MSEASDLQRRADDLADSVAAIAARASSKATRRLRKRIGTIRRDLVRLWVQMFGSVTSGPADLTQASAFAVEATRLLTEGLTPALVSPRPVVEAWVTAYYRGAASTGLAPATDFTVPPLDLTRPVDRAATAAVAGLSAVALHAMGFNALAVALARAEKAVANVGTTTAFELHRAASRAVSDIARDTGQLRVWIAERDACLHCLAYAGETTTGGVFPTGLTFGDKPLTAPGPLTGPPLHPHCRCALQLLDPSDTAVVTALKREAKRSVLRGVALDGEAEKLRAADRLLAVGAGLPKTVEARAAAAVRRGRFERRGPA